MEVNIIHLTYRRKKFAELSHFLLSKCKFKDFHLTLCSVDFDRPFVEEIAQKARDFGLNVSVVSAPSVHDNYLIKINEALKQPFKYTIKMDEDVFIGPQAWDFLFNNIHILDDDQNVLLAPTLSTGIPSCDDFIEYNLSAKDKYYLYRMFKNTAIPNLWGSDYSEIHNYLHGPNEYNSTEYFNHVRKVSNIFKGIHPVRINFKIVKFINDRIKSNIHKFVENRGFFIKEMTQPYFCNTLFAIKSVTYKKIINDPNLYVDGFDEAPINKYRDKNGLKFQYIPNVFGIHILYNTLIDVGYKSNIINKYEENFYDYINTELKKILS